MGLKPGKYTAKAVYGEWKNVGQKQTPAVQVTFEIGQDKIQHTMYLTNTPTKDGSTVMHKTFDTLYGTLGLDESKQLYQDTTSSGEEFFYFDHTFLAKKEVSLTLENQQDPKDPTKFYLKVKWINELGGNSVTGKRVEQVIGNIDYKAEAAAARARMGVKKPMVTNEIEDLLF